MAEVVEVTEDEEEVAAREHRRTVLRLTLQYLEAASHPWAHMLVYVPE